VKFKKIDLNQIYFFHLAYMYSKQFL